MATGLKISTESLGSDIEKIATSIRNIRAYMTVIRNAAVALNSMWEGPSKQAFIQQINSDCENMESLLKTIAEYKNALENANTQYRETSGNIESYINSIRL